MVLTHGFIFFIQRISPQLLPLAYWEETLSRRRHAASHKALVELASGRADLCGLVTTETLKRALYLMVLVDDCTGYIWAYFLLF